MCAADLLKEQHTTNVIRLTKIASLRSFGRLLVAVIGSQLICVDSAASLPIAASVAKRAIQSVCFSRFARYDTRRSTLMTVG